jgi:hypothetical protein
MPAIYPILIDELDTTEEAQAFIDSCPPSVHEWLSIEQVIRET